MAIKERIHVVFISIFNVLLRSDSQKKQDQTLCLLYELIDALHTYPCLWEIRRRPQLQKMADIFKKLGRYWAYERMLEGLAAKMFTSMIGIQDDPCILLAESLAKTSDIIRQLLADFLLATTGETNPPEHL